MVRRSISFLLAVMFICVCLPFWGVEAAATSYDKPNTHVNTGDQRFDIVQVALTQKGYYEGPGNNNDTKYGERLGINYLGWCGAFVSWCAIEAGIPDSVLRKTGVASPDAFGLSRKPDGYVPKSGDLFFSKDYSHVGLVWYVDGDHFYSIEGNTWTSNSRHGVYVQKKLISGHCYASPNYRGGGDHKYILGTEEKHPHKEFYKCNSCTDMYYTGKTETVTDCKECQQAMCSHSFSTWSKLNDNNHSRVCKKCDKTETKSHSWNTGSVTKPATCNSAGTKVQTCSGCSAQRTVTMPKTGVHTYGEWLKFNDMNHSRECISCGVKQTNAHIVSKEWVTNEKQHWNNCSICMEQFQLADHQFGDTCDTPCKICNYTNPDGHSYDEVWKLDDSGHWKTCMNCTENTEVMQHAFSADCDEDCDVCGFTRHTLHSFSDAYVTDDKDHWYECGGCGKKMEIQPHQPDNTSREGVMQHCTVCGLQLISDRQHTHAYDDLYQDYRYHWGTCSCGLEMTKESHTWSVQSGDCSICGMAYAEENNNEYADLLPWILGASGMLIFVIVMVIVAIVIKNRE